HRRVPDRDGHAGGGCRHPRTAVLIRHARNRPGARRFSVARRRPAARRARAPAARRCRADPGVEGAPVGAAGVGALHGRATNGADMQLGFVGLGKMGLNMVTRLARGGHAVVAYDRSADAVAHAGTNGAQGVASLEALVKALAAPRAVWVMVPAGAPTE